MKIDLVTETITVAGIRLPWRQRKTYPPNLHKVLKHGEVFIPLDLLQKVCDRTADDYLYHPIPAWEVTHQQEWALIEEGLAEKEARGFIHGTERGRRVLAQLKEQQEKTA
jgi:hypothetical protein